MERAEKVGLGVAAAGHLLLLGATGDLAGRLLLPALRDEPDAVLLADGFSCRTQAADLLDRRGIHLAQLLDPEPTVVE